ncbi:MAG: ABC transporter ATP-binding protein [Mycoplasmatales bacterium]
MSYVSFNNVGKKYPGSEELSVQKFDLDIQEGEFIVFVGPSGCGKSTTLRMLAGLEEISEGEISISDVVVNNVHPKDRDIAMVFQNYALYPHMDVYTNISFGLKLQKVKKNEIEKKVAWAADVLGLTEYLDRKPKDLSGGQRQRVALGRAIVRNPKVFLMDEPLSNLDAKLRVSMRNEITRLHRDLQATTVYVTHDQVEAMTMADRIVVMKDGIIQQIGAPLEIFKKPSNLFVAEFIGAPKMNIINVKCENEAIIFEDGQKIPIPLGILKEFDLVNGKNYLFGFRPEHISLDKVVLDAFPEEIISVKITNLEKMGSTNHLYSNHIGNGIVITEHHARESVKIGDIIEFRIDMNKIHFFDVDSHDRI